MFATYKQINVSGSAKQIFGSCIICLQQFVKMTIFSACRIIKHIMKLNILVVNGEDESQWKVVLVAAGVVFISLA